MKFTALILVLAGITALPAYGGGRSTHESGGSFSLVMVTDRNGDRLPNWGDLITFDIETTATTQPFVDVTCSQNGVLVYGATAGFFEGYPWPWTKVMSLGSSAWQGGAANCTARLYYLNGRKTPTLATFQFTANP